jgi:hypothetical protein
LEEIGGKFGDKVEIEFENALDEKTAGKSHVEEMS